MKRQWYYQLYSSIFFSILLFITSSFSVFAEPETVFEESVEEGDTFELDDETYTVYEYADYTGVRISSNKYGSIIIQEVGRSTMKGPYTFTLDSITQDGSDVTFDITVNKEKSKISVSREASNSTAKIGDQLIITVTISNDGENTVTVKYAETLPSKASLVGKPEITAGTTTSTQKSTTADVYWKGALYSGESVTITYIIYVDGYPSDGTTLSFNDVDYTYEDDTGEYSETVDTLDITLLDPLTISFTQVTDNDDIKVYAEVEYDVILTNNLDKTISVSSFFLALSELLTPTIIDISLEEKDDGYTWSDDINAFEDVSFSIFVTPEAGGIHTLNGYADYTYGSGGEIHSTSESASFSIEVEDVVPEIKLSSESFDGGEPILIYYYVNNSDETVSYSDARIKISSDPSNLFDTINYVASLPKKTKTLIKKQNFTAPYTDTAMEYTLTMSGDLGAAGTFEESETISINPSSFTVPYALSYTVEGFDNDDTNLTLVVSLITTLAEKPSKFSIVHRANPDYKKTVSLSTDAITALFSGESQTRSWSVPTSTFSGDSVELSIQLQYDLSTGTYYKSLSETIPVYNEAVEKTGNEINTTETNETDSTEIGEGNETILVVGNKTEANVSDEYESSVVIRGEKEQTSDKFFWFVVIFLSISAVSAACYYLFMKKQKQENIKKSIESMTKEGASLEKKGESFLEKAKEIIIYDVPTPEEGYERLESYLRHVISQGKSNEEIKKILAAKGWLDDILDSYLRRLK